MMYKIHTNNLVHVDQRYFSYNLRNTRRRSLHLYHLPTRINAYYHSFYPSSIRIWNNLPECVISSTTVDLFKHRLCELETIYLASYINNNDMYVILLWRPVHYLQITNYQFTIVFNNTDNYPAIGWICSRKSISS